MNSETWYMTIFGCFSAVLLFRVCVWCVCVEWGARGHEHLLVWAPRSQSMLWILLITESDLPSGICLSPMHPTGFWRILHCTSSLPVSSRD